MSKERRYEKDMIFVLREARLFRPRDMQRVPCVTDFQRIAEAYFDYAMKEWVILDKRFVSESVEFWFEKNEQLKVNK